MKTFADNPQLLEFAAAAGHHTVPSLHTVGNINPALP